MLACWQWANFVEAQCGPTRRVVYVNMDETAIRLWQGGRHELLHVPAWDARKIVLDREERGSLAERRQNSTMVAFISACAEVQALLPLFMLLNERHIIQNAAQPIVQEFAANRNVVFFTSEECLE